MSQRNTRERGGGEGELEEEGEGEGRWSFFTSETAAWRVKCPLKQLSITDKDMRRSSSSSRMMRSRRWRSSRIRNRSRGEILYFLLSFTHVTHVVMVCFLSSFDQLAIFPLDISSHDMHAWRWSGGSYSAVLHQVYITIYTYNAVIFGTHVLYSAIL